MSNNRILNEIQRILNGIQRILNGINFHKKMRKQMLSMNAYTFMMDNHLFCRLSIMYKFPQECKRDDCVSCACYLNDKKKYLGLFSVIKLHLGGYYE
jgi:hypothetical protein